MEPSNSIETDPEELIPISDSEEFLEESFTSVNKTVCSQQDESPNEEERHAEKERARKGKSVLLGCESHQSQHHEEAPYTNSRYNILFQKWVTPELVPSHPRALQMQARGMIFERGFDFSIPSFPKGLMSNINELGWRNICGGTPGAVEGIVRDFYTNFNPYCPTLTSVRSVPVTITPMLINAFYKLNDVFEDDYLWTVFTVTPHFMEIMKADLAIPGGEWSDAPRGAQTFPAAFLTPQAHSWFKLVARKIKPTMQTKHISMDHMALIHAIMRRTSIDVGGLIMNEMAAAVQAKEGSLPFPNLITELCLRANVPLWKEERFAPPKRSINPEDSGWIKREKKAEAWFLPEQRKKLLALEERFLRFLAFDKERHHFLHSKIGIRFPRYVNGLPSFPESLLKETAAACEIATEETALFSDDEDDAGQKSSESN